MKECFSNSLILFYCLISLHLVVWGSGLLCCYSHLLLMNACVTFRSKRKKKRTIVFLNGGIVLPYAFLIISLWISVNMVPMHNCMGHVLSVCWYQHVHCLIYPHGHPMWGGSAKLDLLIASHLGPTTTTPARMWSLTKKPTACVCGSVSLVGLCTVPLPN